MATQVREVVAMKKDLTNNLFNYATKELSQDAFICWLASYAKNDKLQDSALRDCAKKLLAMFCPELEGREFDLVDIEKQVKCNIERKNKFIDVLLTVCCEERIYKIIVEDKTYTNQHDNQLLNYKDSIERDFPNAVVKGVYYKTWYQADLTKVEEAGYKVVLRENVLELMGRYCDKTENMIFKDYYDYWNTMQLDCMDFENLPTEKWNANQLYAFYDYLKNGLLKNRGLDVGYDYVNNPNGGFHGLWAWLPNGYKRKTNGRGYELYLQVHATNVDESCCDLKTYLRLAISDEEKNITGEEISFIRNEIIYDVDDVYKLGEYGFKKPPRLGHGRSMNIGLYKFGQGTFASYKDFEKILEEAVDDYLKLLFSLH